MEKQNNIQLQKTILSAIFLSLALVLPLLTSQIKEIGDTLLPMHIPIMLCGVLCGWGYGLTVGFITPFMRSAIFGMPPIYPNAVYMALELAAYGFIIGFLYKKKINIYISLITAQILGRIVWGVSKAVLLGILGESFGFKLFLIGGFSDAIPGIILQLILIPIIIFIIEKIVKRKI